MKIDFAQVVKDVNGNDIKDEVGKETSLGTLCVNAVLGVYPDERDLAGDIKIKRWKLAKKIKSASEVDLSVEEVAMVLQLCAKGFSTGVYGPIQDLLDQ